MVPAFPAVVRHLNRRTNMLVLVDAQGRLHSASQWACVRYTNGRVKFADAIRQAKHRPMIHQYFKSLKDVHPGDVDTAIRDVLHRWRYLDRKSFELWLEVTVPNYEV